MPLRGDAIRQAKLGQTKPSGPTGLEMRRPFLRKETRKRKSYAIDRPFCSDFESIGLSFFLILFEADRIENEIASSCSCGHTNPFVLIALGFDLYDLRAVSVRGVIRNPRKYQLRLPPRSHEDLYVLVQSRTTEIFRSGNGARRGRRYAPLLHCDRPPDYVKESRLGGLAHSGSPPPLVIDQTNRHRSMPLKESLLPPSQLRIRSRGAQKPWADRPGLSLLFCSHHNKGARKRYAPRAEGPLRVSVVSCAPLSSSAPPGSQGCWPNKHLPAAPVARLTGGALVILIVLSVGAPLIALAISYDLERYYESSVPDSIVAAIWFTGTTKKSHAYVTVIDCFIILDYEGPGHASGFHSRHHIDDKSPRALP
ncbi:hypothetical protein V6N12_028964 [Hibiscus sabdariffa]|uniref:Uncharacterized protein n=1 Tax=Hibiscus sabdariffa TaxID=183260 RepID=A0ABR2F7E1_9ROSI